MRRRQNQSAFWAPSTRAKSRYSLGVNLVAPVVVANLFCRVFTDDAIERRIINVSSGAAQSGIAGGGTYSIAKAGLEMLTKQLVADLRTPTLRAITVRPGIIDTGMQVLMRTQPDASLAKRRHVPGIPRKAVSWSRRPTRRRRSSPSSSWPMWNKAERTATRSCS